MAAVFLESIHRAASDGKIAKAEPIEEITEPFCDKFEGTGTDAGGKTQRGSGYADGFYSHDSKEMGASICYMSKKRKSSNVSLTWIPENLGARESLGPISVAFCASVP